MRRGLRVARDQVQEVALPLVAPVAQHDQRHRSRNEQPEQDDRAVDRHPRAQHQRVQADHRQNADVLVEVLHGDRVTGAHQDVAAVLQQRVHRHDEEARARADADHQHHRHRRLRHEDHRDHDDAHHDPDRQDLDGAAQRNVARREHGAGRYSAGDDALQHRRLRQVEAERPRRPVDQDELQRRARTPEQRRRRERHLAELVAPQQRHAMRELADQVERVAADAPVVDAGVRDEPVEDCRDDVEEHDHADRRLGNGLDSRVDDRHVESEQERRDAGADQRPAGEHAEDDRRDRRALDPAVGDDELLRRQKLGEDPVLGRRVGGRAEADDRVRGERMQREQHQQAPRDLDAVGDQHDLALRHRIGERADQRREQHVRQDEALLQRRRHPTGLVQVAEQGDRGDQQRVVGERTEELRRHDRVETGLHHSPGLGRGPAKAAKRSAGIRYNRERLPAARVLYHDYPVA